MTLKNPVSFEMLKEKRVIYLPISTDMVSDIFNLLNKATDIRGDDTSWQELTRIFASNVEMSLEGTFQAVRSCELCGEQVRLLLSGHWESVEPNEAGFRNLFCERTPNAANHTFGGLP